MTPLAVVTLVTLVTLVALEVDPLDVLWLEPLVELGLVLADVDAWDEVACELE